MRTAPGGVIGASRAAFGYVLFGLGPILVICAAGVLMPDLLLRTVYGPSSPYLAVAIGLQLLVVAGVLDYIAEMISKTLLGVEAGRLAFLVNVVAVVAALVLALALIGPLGVFGACLALLIANLVRVIGAVIAIAWLIAAKARQQRSAWRRTAAGVGPIERFLARPRSNEEIAAMSDTQVTMTDTLKKRIPSRAFRGRSYLALLAIVLLGYALMGKGFAYLGFPPLYVGEIAFLTGIVVFLRIGAFVGVLATLPGLVLVALMAWVLARHAPVR